ncbi:putative FAD-dependent oxidoreductase [Actinoplanes missouriensis 431]|uniref:Putative FAD-dependent oxidoreductase n=1 Tax=Actinoplanes missouriensis (strain ATCC 14538 / DSM 43046 / CBS 188.64 / JCM 3121 / NBRC 102363 / NCIMB 12654 / NRRL B-3342 / UNCC 431) TaxID=512565 RepID=I0HES5_ACTM4|nr:FAD-dependent monooxygenase [Actinoplanes missouriensis]BAL91512.1 putative FAD-dependent oxidoreductase [Actinoplanes missouriensis 431]
MTNRKALISGAGVGGPACAFWLARAGWEVTLVERAPALRTGGYKVDVRGAATTVLKRMGVHAAAKQRDTGMRQVTYVRRDGRRIASLPADLLMGRRGDDLEIMRGDLTRLLHDAAGVATVFGDSIAGISDTCVTFASGRTGEYDLIVAADGLHSTTRRLAFGDTPIDHLGGYISTFEVPNDLGIDHEEIMYTEPGRLLYAYAMGPGAPARVGMTFASEPLTYDRRDLGAQKQLLHRAFAGRGWRSDDFLAALDDAPDLYFDSLSQVNAPRYSSGRVVLLGDAAYCPSPASGQGTSLALVGAYVLADQLSNGGGLEGYERVMRPYVEKNLAFGRRMAKDMVPSSRLAIGFRNYGMRTLRFHPRKEQMIDKVLAPMHEAANAIAI